jgi:protein TonB
VVDVLFTVHTDGRVSGCRIDHSSGSPELDRLTCALTEQRLLYNPALDASGKPTEEIAGRRFRFVMSPRRDR